MKKILLALALLNSVVFGQQPAPLMNVWIPGITRTTVIDNRSATNRQMTYVAIGCSGSGTWSASLSYGSTSSGSFTSYGSQASITNASATPVAQGFLLLYPNYIKVTITGTATCNLSGFQRYYETTALPGSGTVTEITLAGTSNQITVAGTCDITTTGTCTFSIPSDFRIPGTINKITMTQPATGATFTLADGKTFVVNRSMTFTGTDGVTITFPSSSATLATIDQTNTFTGRQDASAAASTAPAKAGTSLPATCVTGDQYFKTDATAGQNLYGCTSTNVWTLQAGGGGGSPAFSAITNGTNTTAAMVIGTGASISATGSGTIAATTAAALAANPTDCSAGQYATTIAANGNLTCAQVAYSQVSGTPTLYYQTVQDEAVSLTTRPTINFTGSGVTCTDNAGQSRTDCTVAGGGGSAAFSDITSGTNLSAAMIIGTGSSLTTAGSGTISATTATRLSANGTNCSSGQFAQGVDATGNAEGCTALPTTLTGTANQIAVSASTGAITLSIPTNPTLPGTTTGTFSGNLTGAVTGNASTATALASNPADCTAGQYATTIAANGDLTCAQVAYSQLSGTPTLYYQTVADEGIALTARPTVNFIGSGVTCADNSGQSRTDCTISGGGGGSSAFNDITSGTNSSAAMVVGTGANLSTSGSGTIAATTATALAANGTNCSAGAFAAGVDANGNAEGCTALPTTLTGTANQITVSASTGAITISIPTNPTLPGTTTGTFSGSLSGNATTATALAANPSDCSAGQYATTIAANGNLTCAQVAYSQVSGTPTIYYQTVQDEGSSTTQRATVNFTGAGVTCADNGGSSRTDCTIPGTSVFGGSTASTSAFSATPTFSLADVSVKSPVRFEPGALTANVTSVTFTNKTAGAKFSIAWLQDGTGGRTVAYGASASNTCTISTTAGKTTTQFFEVKADGTSVVGVGCTSDDPADTPGNPASTISVSYSATPTFTATSNTSNTFTMTLTGNVSSCTIASATTGQSITLLLTQDGTGGRTFACAGFSGLGSVDTTAGRACSQSFVATSASAAQAVGGMTCNSPYSISLTSGGNVVGTFPTGTYNLVGDSTTQTLTGKTFDTAGSGNVLRINGTGITSVAGNTAKVQLAGTGTPATNDCAKFDANGNIVTAGAACGGGALSSTLFWPWGLPTSDRGGGGATPNCIDYTYCFSPSANTGSNYGTSLGFENEVTRVSSGLVVYVGAAAGASKGFQVSVYDSADLTAPLCKTTLATSGGSPDINSTGAITLAWGSGSAVSGGNCTLPVKRLVMVFGTDSTALLLGPVAGDSRMASTYLAAVGNVYAGYNSAVTTGSSGTLAIVTDVSGISWSSNSPGVLPAVMFK